MNSKSRHSYTVSWKEESFNGDSDPGWYCEVSNFIAWGPFDSQQEAFESMIMEWPRFEHLVADNDSCNSDCTKEKCDDCPAKLIGNKQ